MLIDVSSPQREHTIPQIVEDYTSGDVFLLKFRNVIIRCKKCEDNGIITRYYGSSKSQIRYICSNCNQRGLLRYACHACYVNNDTCALTRMAQYTLHSRKCKYAV